MMDMGERSEEADIGRLYAFARPKIARYFRWKGARAEDVTDLTQEVFLRFVSIAPTLTLRTPEAYLRLIAHNLLRDRSRIARRHSADQHIALDEIPLTGPSPEAQLEARDMLNRLETAMLDLGPRTREVFMACRIDGLSYAEIAERTGLSSRAITRHMARALAHIDRIFGED